MMKVTVILEQPKNADRFNRHYIDVHLPLIYALPGVQNVHHSYVTESQFSLFSPYIIASFEFESEELMKVALNSEFGARLYADVPNLMNDLHHPPQILFSKA
ncbi:EthD family reductase [Paenibacillus turpanensis]|uniref:EthD family reductase n=1 Tax=Paenibacillus turpanensis TaxID=2689078 RepID=UPI0014085489|nr:EthD family reductase [Paenibacillus turpanensis]